MLKIKLKGFNKRTQEIREFDLSDCFALIDPNKEDDSGLREFLTDPDLAVYRYLGENFVDCNNRRMCEGDLVELGGENVKQTELGVVIFNGVQFTIDIPDINIAKDDSVSTNQVKWVGTIFQDKKMFNEFYEKKHGPV